ncbi:hypothetical protein HK100_003216, partial [Physocladia obscura]
KIIKPFVEEHINKYLYKEESEKHVFSHWLQNIDGRASNYAWWLTIDGDIKEELKPTQEELVADDEDEAGKIAE